MSYLFHMSSIGNERERERESSLLRHYVEFSEIASISMKKPAEKPFISS